jgi:hypothetical protein
VNTPDFSESDWIINPDLFLVEGVPLKYWKIVGDSVQEMTPEEKAIVDAAEANATPIINGENYQVDTYDSDNYLASQTWYKDRVETGVYTTKVKEIIYTRLENSMTQKVTNSFSMGGSILSSETEKYYTDLDTKKTYVEKTV